MSTNICFYKDNQKKMHKNNTQALLGKFFADSFLSVPLV